MVGDNQIQTDLDVRTNVQDSSINDSIFFSSSVSVDVISLLFVIGTLFLAICLYLRSMKRISMLEKEMAIVLRLLKRSQVFTEDSMC